MPEQDEPMEMQVFNVANDNSVEEVVEPEVIQITPEQMEIQNLAAFCTIQVGQDPRTGELHMGIVQIPVPIDMINEFQSQMGEEMAKENMKFVVYKGKAFLAPVQTTSLIGFS